MSLHEMREDFFADIPVVADDSDGSGHCWMSDYVWYADMLRPSSVWHPYIGSRHSLKHRYQLS